MRVPRLPVALVALVLLGPALVAAQDEPFSAGQQGVPVPKKKKHVQPVYPQEALAQGIRGIVILDLVIDTDGRVASVGVIRSIAGLDEAAIAAASQWEYEVTKVAGRPVSVRLTVPITFALRLPDVSKQAGIPELRQGVTPPWPPGERSGGRATADVTLDPDGRVGVARILEGEEPWSSALIQGLRTWRFAVPPEDAVVSFRVEADFVPAPNDKDRRVALRLTGLRQSQTLASPAPEPADVAALEPPPDAPGGAVEEDASEAETHEEAAGEGHADLATPEPTGNDVAAHEPGAGPAGTGEPPAVARAVPPPAAGPADAAGPRGEPGPPEGETAASDASPTVGTKIAGGPDVDPTAPPPVEVITAEPPPLPPENGISALPGVTLEPGVPDLTQGRRPVAPPLARMARTSGEVEVDFSVGPGGTTVVGAVRGPEILQPAARAAVETWTFRRTRADRLYLTAVFMYEGDAATAAVRPQGLP